MTLSFLKFQEFVKKRGNKGYYVRGTYTHNNTDFTNDIFPYGGFGVYRAFNGAGCMCSR